MIEEEKLVNNPFKGQRTNKGGQRTHLWTKGTPNMLMGLVSFTNPLASGSEAGNLSIMGYPQGQWKPFKCPGNHI